jgi:hypothetical protein
MSQWKMALSTLTAELPEEVAKRIKRQTRQLQNTIRLQYDTKAAKRVAAAKRKRYREDPEYRARVVEHHRKWWASKTPEEKAEYRARWKLNKYLREQNVEYLEKKRAQDRERKRETYARNEEVRERLKARARAFHAGKTEAQRKEDYRKRKERLATLPAEEYERRKALQAERCRQYRLRKKQAQMQLISNAE